MATRMGIRVKYGYTFVESAGLTSIARLHCDGARRMATRMGIRIKYGYTFVESAGLTSIARLHCDGAVILS